MPFAIHFPPLILSLPAPAKAGVEGNPSSFDFPLILSLSKDGAAATERVAAMNERRTFEILHRKAAGLHSPCAPHRRASCCALMWATSYAATGSLSDAPGSSALVAAVAWLQGTLLGTIATTIAIVAVSWVGMLMLMGRFEIRRGLTVIVGCFILFGASAIAGGIQSFVGRGEAEIAYVPPPVAPPPQVPPLPRNPDPYAGASVPTR